MVSEIGTGISSPVRESESKMEILGISVQST